MNNFLIGGFIILEIAITDWIQAISAVISLVTSITAVIISVKSLKLTEKSILDANRPYVTMYVETIDTIYFSKHLVIKNFGKTSAKIKSLHFISELDDFNKEKQMQSIVGGTIAPNQKIATSLKNNFNEIIKAEIVYLDLNNKKYKEIIIIKTDMSKDLKWSRQNASEDSNESAAIKHSTHAILRAFK